MAIFESFLTYELPTHVLVIHIRVLVSDGLDIVVDHQPYLIPKDLPPEFSYENGPLGENHSSINWVDLTLFDDDEN
ncbi:hypothetical protein CJ030_MR7G016907 [Morella rubra]|uniref:Uncharacterized protein n=1 Tax=Morella rubra TaxID=262757 RepID=A0A6A1V234_9ROSI|nr:hypothetical protein CJ030_MR7G016907 [Morella rubra]